MRRVHLHLIALSTALAVSSGAWAQQYPERQITMLVGFAPGGGTDTTARIIAKRLSEVLGKPVIVDNRPGASGNIAQEMLVRSAPDGYTIMLGSLPSLAI